MYLYETTVALATDAVATTDYTSNSYALNGALMYSIQVIFPTGTMAGTFTIEASNDTALGFVTIVASSTAITASAPFLYNPPGNIGYKFVRFKWVRTTGTGTLTAALCVKGVQG